MNSNWKIPADDNSFATFSDPDGNGWLIQEIGGDPFGTVVVSQRGSSPRDRMAREHCLHVRVEGASAVKD